MLNSSGKLDYAKAYLRRKYSLDQLKALADQVFESATETVTLTANSYEGGSGSGVVTFDKAILGLAIEQLILELDPSAPRGVSPIAHSDFSQRPVSC